MEDLEYMKSRMNANGKGVIKMLSEFIPGQEGKEVPDAYYARGRNTIRVVIVDQAACFEEIFQMADIGQSRTVAVSIVQMN